MIYSCFINKVYKSMFNAVNYLLLPPLLNPDEEREPELDDLDGEE